MTSDRQPTVYIHVGPHKTGSSSIKHFCRANRDRLARLGLFYPLLMNEQGRPARNHEELARVREIRPDGGLRPQARLWLEIEEVAARGGADILLSSEMFCNALGDQEMLARILTYFETRGYRVVVLAYVRDQPGWLNSWYVQSQKRLSGLATFDQFCANAEETGRVDPWFYLKKFIDEPRCELEVISFERAIGAGLELDFIRRCGIPADAGLQDIPPRNPNAGTKSVYAAQEIMRAAGPQLKKLKGFGPVYNQFKRRCVELRFDETPYVALDQQRYERIRARYAATNESFAQAFFGLSWTDLCPPRSFSVSTFDPARAQRRELGEIKDLVADIIAKLQKRRRQEERRARRLADEGGPGAS